ncbi:MAG TPA: glycosyltransferase family 4 protein [Candidatus Acidoferrum sp.]|nr:glycosyltransferase family 4 protein [Candidatus Acidoferrum sp.]
MDRRHGTERALAELLERLARDEHCEIHLYSQRVEDLAFCDAFFLGPGNSGRILWHKVPSMRGPHLLQFVAWLLLNAVCRVWDRRVRGLRFDLVLSPGINCLDADVVIVHALFHRLQELSREEDRDSANPGVFRGLHRRAYYALLTSLERWLYSDPKVALAAVSGRTADLLAHYFQRKDVPVIPNGVDAAQFSPSARLARRKEARRARNFQENDFVLLLIGNDWRVKGLPAVLRAMGTLRGLPFHLIVVGNDAPESFRECAKQLGILERCHFEPPRQEVLDLYAAADLYVSPSLEDSFGLPVAEAMACGLPVITSQFAGVSDLIHNAVDGLVLGDPLDSEELAGSLNALFSDPARRQRVGEAAAKKALEWNWDRNAAAVFQLLKEAVAGK